MFAVTCLFFLHLDGLTEVLDQADVSPDTRLDVRGISGHKTYSLVCFVFLMLSWAAATLPGLKISSAIGSLFLCMIGGSFDPMALPPLPLQL